MTNYKDLEIHRKALELFYKIHSLSLKLPKHELYELGGQIRRSADSVETNIVEGYGRKAYKKDFIKFLIFSHASCLETQTHIQKISHIYPNFKEELEELFEEYDILGAQIYKFTEYVKNNWKND